MSFFCVFFFRGQNPRDVVMYKGPKGSKSQMSQGLNSLYCIGDGHPTFNRESL